MKEPGIVELLREACRGEPWAVRSAADEVIVTVPVREDRQQEVVATEFEEDSGPVVRFHTVIGPVKDLTGSRPLAALRLNFALISGAFAIHDEDVVLCRLCLLRDLDADEIRDTVRYLAETGDRYEEHIYGTDVH